MQSKIMFKANLKVKNLRVKSKVSVTAKKTKKNSNSLLQLMLTIELLKNAFNEIQLKNGFSAKNWVV